jgi:hypothetical protein
MADGHAAAGPVGADALDAEQGLAGGSISQEADPGTLTAAGRGEAFSVQRDGGVVDTVTSAVNSAVEAASEEADSAVSWAESEVGKAALSAVSWMASSLGASVTVVGTAIHVDIPDISLFDAEQSPVLEMPRVVVPIPIAVGTAGPCTADLLAELALEVRGDGVIGPGSVRNIHLVIDALAGTGSATGQLHIAGSATVAEEPEIGLDGLAACVIPVGEVPVPIEADVFGGIRGTLQVTGLGNLDETVTVSYTGSAITLDAVTTLKVGLHGQVSLDAVAELNIEDFTACEYKWPIASKDLGEEAWQVEFPISVGYSSSGPSFSAEPPTAQPIPLSEIEGVLPKEPSIGSCKPLDELIAYLCTKGILPPELCPTPGPGPGGGPGVGPVPLAPPGPGGGGGSPVSPAANYPSGLTAGDPIPITWFKPLSIYPDPITLTDSVGSVNEYQMDKPGQFVEPGREIGVAAAYLPEEGKKVTLEKVIEDEDRGPEVDRFKSLIDRHGQSATCPSCFSRAGFDIDHVQDLAWGGEDRPDNLWPLGSTPNQAAGRQFRAMRITYSNVQGGGPATPTTTNIPLNTAAGYTNSDNVIGRYFVIERFQNP